MKSRFYFSYATIFFFLLFFFANVAGEPGSTLGTLVFSLSLAVFYEAVSLIADIDGYVQFAFGVIFVWLAGISLYLLSPEYSLLLLGAGIPIIILPYCELFLGKESYQILVISIFEVLGFVLFVITAYAGIIAKLDKVVPGFMLSGASFEESAGSAFINLFFLSFVGDYQVVLCVYYAF